MIELLFRWDIKMDSTADDFTWICNLNVCSVLNIESKFLFQMVVYIFKRIYLDEDLIWNVTSAENAQR